MKRLSQQQITLLAAALRVAAEQYERDAETMVKAAQHGLAQEFRTMKGNALALAEDFDCADEVTIHE